MVNLIDEAQKYNGRNIIADGKLYDYENQLTIDCDTDNYYFWLMNNDKVTVIFGDNSMWLRKDNNHQWEAVTKVDGKIRRKKLNYTKTLDLETLSLLCVAINQDTAQWQQFLKDFTQYQKTKDKVANLTATIREKDLKIAELTTKNRAKNSEIKKLKATIYKNGIDDNQEQWVANNYVLIDGKWTLQ